VIDQLRHRAESEGNDRCPGGHRLDDRQAERLGEADQVQQGQRTTQQAVALGRPHRPDVGDVAAQLRLHLLAEVPLVLHDPGDHQRHPGAASNLDRQVGALVRMDPAEEQQIAAGLRHEGEPGQVDAVVDGRGVAQVRVSIGVADRDVVRVIVVGPEDREDPFGGEPVDGGDHRGRHQPAVGQRQEIELIGHQIELARPLEGRRDVQASVDLGIDGDVFLVTGRRFTVQSSRGQRISGGEQRDIVAEAHQALGQRGRDLLPGPVTAWRRAMRHRGQDRDAQGCGHP